MTREAADEESREHPDSDQLRNPVRAVAKAVKILLPEVSHSSVETLEHRIRGLIKARREGALIQEPSNKIVPQYKRI